MILQCSCKNSYQDKTHGTDNRVHNPKAKKQGAEQVWKCSVCSAEKKK
jgi:hypothetical protein